MPLKGGELYATLRLQTRDFEQGLDAAKGRFSGLRSTVESGVRTVAGAFAATTTALTGLGVAALKVGLDYNRMQQSSRAALTTLLGSAEAANAQMDKLDEFARSSPFAKQIFIQAQQQLIGFGMAAEDVLPTLDAIQNAVAAVGGSNEDISEVTRILATVQSSGKITAETLNQLGVRGIDAATLIGESMGMTGQEIRDSITAGSLDAGEAIEALTTGMMERFGGATANIKQQMDGAADRVKGAWRDIGSALARPFIDPTGGGLAVDWTNQFADALRALEKQAGPVVNLLTLRLGPASDAISTHLTGAKTAIDGFNVADLNRGLDEMTKYTPLIAGLGTALFTMGAGSLPILSQLGFAGISPVVAGLGALVLASPEARDAVGQVLEAAEPLLPLFGSLALALSDLAMHALRELMPPLGELGAALMESGVSIATGLLPPLTELVRASLPLVDVLADVVGWMAELPAPVLAAAAALVALKVPGQALGAVFTNLKEQAAVQAALGGTSQAVGGLSVAMMGAKAPVQALGTALKTAFISNPIGWAITGVVAALTVFGGAQRDAQRQSEELAATLDQETAAITENTRGWVINSAEKAGLLEDYISLGGASADYVDAILGEEDAIARVNAVLDEHSTIVEGADGTYKIYDSTAANLINRMEQYQGEVDAATESTERKIEADRRATEESRTYTDVLQREIDALREKADAHDRASGAALNTAAAQSRLAAQYERNETTIKAVTDALNEGVQVTNDQSTAFDLNTEAGRNAHDALVQTARASNDLTSAMIENFASQGDVKRAAEEARQKFI
ncbi:MAG: tape measure protein, partial [Propionibacteriaceae bacterium]|nr:tape measure protein [Propionibacteriaceae bacterium]